MSELHIFCADRFSNASNFDVKSGDQQTMNLKLVLLLSWLPSRMYGFMLSVQQPVVGHYSLATVSPRYVSRRIMTLRVKTPSTSTALKLLGKVLLGGTLLTGVVSGIDRAHAEVSVSPVCECMIRNAFGGASSS